MKEPKDREEVIDALIADYSRNALLPIDCGDIDLIAMEGNYFSNRVINTSSNMALKIQNELRFDEVILTDAVELGVREYLNETASIKYRLTYNFGEKESKAVIHLFPKTKHFSTSGFLGRDYGTYEFIDDSLCLKTGDSTEIITLKENGGVGVLYYSTKVDFIDGVIVEREEPKIKW